MYFPYLRAKQYELLALRESVDGIKSNGKIFPIIEPVKRNVADLARTLRLLEEKSVPYVFVVNPTVGGFKESPELVDQHISRGEIPLYKKAVVAYVITKGTSAEHIQNFLRLYDSRHLAFLHCHRYPDPQQLIDLTAGRRSMRHILLDRPTGQAYQDIFRGRRRILVTDPFHKRTNTEYADAPDEFFSDAHNTFAASGWDGFGDFSVVGKKFSGGGGECLAVALHLVYQQGGRELRIRHFVSDSNGSAGKTSVKFFEALAKLVAFLDEHPEIDSSACREFRDRLSRKQYDNLGHAKRLAIKHHLELMMKIL
jgi:hypothetical protein